MGALELLRALCSWRAAVVAKRRDVGARRDVRIAQGEDLAVGHRRESPASINTPLTCLCGAGCDRDRRAARLMALPTSSRTNPVVSRRVVISRLTKMAFWWS